MKGNRFFSRSAGACPPRSLDCADTGEGQALALREGVAFFIVARGPVPRDAERFMKHPQLGDAADIGIRPYKFGAIRSHRPP